MKFDPLKNHRILLIDDNPVIHEAFRKILTPDLHDLDKDEAVLFGDKAVTLQSPIYEISSAYQGEEGLDLIEKSLSEHRPYALAFVAFCMPPGWDGIETVCKIWEVYPDLQVVICTAYPDCAWKVLVTKLGFTDRLIILKKPFEVIEVLQLAVCLTEKWRITQMTKFRIASLQR
jgi:CheY-like chemotaxis protein